MTDDDRIPSDEVTFHDNTEKNIFSSWTYLIHNSNGHNNNIVCSHNNRTGNNGSNVACEDNDSVIYIIIRIITINGALQGDGYFEEHTIGIISVATLLTFSLSPLHSVVLFLFTSSINAVHEK